MRPYNSASAKMLLFSLIAILTTWQGWFFLIGYRLTADDVFYTYIALQGPEAVFDQALQLAIEQGRIGFIFLQPVNMFSALKSEFLIWRILFVTLYFIMVWTACLYVERVLKIAIAPMVFLIFLALHPLAFEHLPPTSYPLQNTLPFLVLFTCRIFAQTYGERGFWLGIGRFSQVVAMLSTEYALLLGVMMILAENFIRHPLRIHLLVSWLPEVVKDARVWGDVITLMLVVIPYITFRLAFPSGYDGNSLDGIGNIGALVQTTFRHIVDGLILPRLRFKHLDAPPMILVGSVLAGLVMYITMRLAFRYSTAYTKSLSAVVLFLVGAMIFVTLPVSASFKQQVWCGGSGHCAFLDSRTSILGVVLLLALAVIKLVNSQQEGTTRERLQRVVAGCFATIFVMASLHNWYVSQKMTVFATVWEDAQTLACLPNLVPESPDHLSNLIDPNRVVPFHTLDASLSFWPLYLDSFRNRRDCAKTDVLHRSLMRSYLPLLLPNKLQAIGGSLGAQFLGVGWSNLEHWGVWSDGKEAQIQLSPQGLVPGEPAILQLDAHVFLDGATTLQRLVISQEGQKIWEGQRSLNNQNEGFEVQLLPHDPTQEMITLTLSMPDANTPQLGGDGRRLGIGLKSLVLRQP